MMVARAGFSLVEVLVSVMMFAIIGVIATGMLNASLTAREINMASAGRAEMIDRARLLMREDFGQLVNRPVRQMDGRASEAGFAGSGSGVTSPAGSGQTLIAFTRAGRPNPGAVQPRGSLQYVEYVRLDDRLIRRSWAYPDRQFDTPASEFVLLSGIDEIEAGFLSLNSWVTGLVSGPAEGQASRLPRAVRLRAVMRDQTDLEFILLTPEFPS
ncbi:type II secretion system minor pseudopilin GspJ [Hyphobacterium indicum]|uniref:type II secretion system minor pseudopilin GspJ n=1 Tax=Hyphobacterium indicum TaxID=2162714 RepID=UPI000D65BF49|nr:type II secretion system minor pseudopilin GspJ [Hyphobacterium indicum]